MAIIEVVKGDGSTAPRRMRARLGWLAGIWAMSTAALFGVASLLHLLMPK
ncbi:DUF2474 domain-containing protein [Acetobacter oeni]|uniref:DUF2474 domain-containing protein n=1 Tax=Acetobacter oeni TaxID=304077 RepID=A0A511XNG9_9PROT|nr:DUF2474 domain-containing protein [Acetobacter oeni]MBB3884334.1 hypothetical protein [Acetobacter oeni]NHO20311.1 DUF2474 family protein [Acetobacter oeni]GEN64488.1 hypothetical protein AOE01nite_27120 [Acetobacter oeni]